MTHVLAPPNAEPTWPYSLAKMRADNPQTSFPSDLSLYDTTANHVYPVAPTQKPEQEGMAAIEVMPELVNGVWQQRWELQPEPPPPVPAAVSMRQARLVLLRAGMLGGVDQILAAIPDQMMRQEAQIEWEYSNEVQRDNPLIAALKAGLGLTAEQVDDLFRLAATL